jgi:hypothetical protein
MPTVTLDASAIADWASFHEVCKAAFGFPDFYGRNTAAWIDCLTYLDEDDRMSRFALKPGETLTIELRGADALADRAPDVALGLFQMVAAVNEPHIADGKAPMLVLVLA